MDSSSDFTSFPSEILKTLTWPLLVKTANVRAETARDTATESQVLSSNRSVSNLQVNLHAFGMCSVDGFQMSMNPSESIDTTASITGEYRMSTTGDSWTSHFSFGTYSFGDSIRA